MTDLNKTIIESDGNYDDPDTFQDYHITANAEVKVYFRDLEQHLISNIQKYPCVIGCVAWMTNKQILKALANLEFVSIVVQKEDFLRPDISAKPGWTTELRKLYSALPEYHSRCWLPGLVNHLSVSYDPTIEPVRCVGNYNREKNPASPRMHNKFLIFCEKDAYDFSNEDNNYIVNWGYSPKEVWTGSFNFTENGVRSLENAVVIDNKEIAKAYYNEWAQILAISEKLDWTHSWIEPEWRIGT